MREQEYPLPKEDIDRFWRRIAASLDLAWLANKLPQLPEKRIFAKHLQFLQEYHHHEPQYQNSLKVSRQNTKVHLKIQNTNISASQTSCRWLHLARSPGLNPTQTLPGRTITIARYINVFQHRRENGKRSQLIISTLDGCNLVLTDFLDKPHLNHSNIT